MLREDVFEEFAIQRVEGVNIGEVFYASQGCLCVGALQEINFGESFCLVEVGNWEGYIERSRTLRAVEASAEFLMEYLMRCDFVFGVW